MLYIVTKFNFLQDSLLETIYKNLISIDALSIQQKDKKVAILTIEVTNEDERFAKFFCENILISYKVLRRFSTIIIW